MDIVETLCHKLCQGCFAYEEDKQGRQVGRKHEQNEKMSKRRVRVGGEDDMIRTKGHWLIVLKCVPEPGIPDTATRSRCEVGVALYLT